VLTFRGEREEEEEEEGRKGGALVCVLPWSLEIRGPRCPSAQQERGLRDCSLFLLLSYSLLILPFVCFLVFSFFIYFLRMGNSWQAMQFSPQ